MKWSLWLSFIVAIIVTNTGCEEIEESPSTSPPPAQEKFIFNPQSESEQQYASLFNTYWSDLEIAQLETIASGVSIVGIDSEGYSNERYASILLKILIKLAYCEQQVDLYLQSVDTLPRTIPFIYDVSSEKEVLEARFLSKYFSEKERATLQLLPSGMIGDVGSADAMIDKVLVKLITLDEKIQLLTSSPTLNIDPKEFIRQYLKEQELRGMMSREDKRLVPRQYSQ